MDRNWTGGGAPPGGSPPGGAPPEGGSPPGAGDPGPFGGAELSFPVAFELRIIYLAAEGAGFAEDAARIFGRLSIPFEPTAAEAKPGSKYGRAGFSVELASREQMYALYDELRKLPYVKAAI